MIPKWKGLVAALALMGSLLACSVSTLPILSTPSSVPTPATGATESPTKTATQAQGRQAGSSTGLIAFVGLDGNVYTTDSEGQHHTPVTVDALVRPSGGQPGRIYQFPTWSPDGQRLAFMRFIGDTTSATQSTLMASTVDGKNQVEAFTSQDTAPFYLFWSPDSQKITFLANNPGGGLALYLAAASGGDSKLVSTGQPYYWDWSPDNRTLIIHTGGDATSNPDARLALVEIDGSVVKNELDLKPGLFQAPAWSPAGASMALTTLDETGGQALVLAGQDGKVTQTLTQLDGPVAFSWSPQGGRLAYTSLIPGKSGTTSSLVLMDTANPDQKKEIGQGGDLLAFFWSPDGSKIAYFVPTGSGPQASVRLVAQNSPQVNLAVDVYDLASGQTQQIATFAPTDSFNEVLPFYDQYQRSGTIWSPDSRSLVLAGVNTGGADAIFVVDAAGGPLHKVADGEVAFWSWK